MNRRHFVRSGLVSLAALTVKRDESIASSLKSIMGTSVKSASMWTYLWDLVDEGYGDVLRRLKETGMSSISLATAYHAGKFLEPHNPKRRIVFTEDGTVYFNPNRKRYGLIQPRVNSLVRDGHGLARTKKEAEKLGLKTRSWIVCCHNTPLGSQYPQSACENVFGDKLFHNLCPSNDEVRKYLRALVADIASHEVDSIELEALQFQGYSHGFHHEREGIELNQASRFLLGLCFCPSCLKKSKAAGFDIEALHSFTRTTLESVFSDPARAADQFPDLSHLPQDLVEPFLEWRRTVVSSLLESLADVAGTVSVRQLMHVDPLARKLVSVDPVAASKITGGFLALAYVRDGESLRQPLHALKKLVGKAEIRAGVQVGLPESGGRKEFLGRMSVLRELGIEHFNFYNYGFIPLQNLEWVKESLAD
jgi:hypothetical protein